MLYGRKPFGQGQSADALLQNRTMTQADGSALQFPPRPSVSEVTKQFIRKCLSRRPEDRPDIKRLFEDPFFVHRTAGGAKRQEADMHTDT